jgi:hypothetical protein
MKTTTCRFCGGDFLDLRNPNCSCSGWRASKKWMRVWQILFFAFLIWVVVRVVNTPDPTFTDSRGLDTRDPDYKVLKDFADASRK